MNKYKLTEETKKINGRVLHRIQALCSFSDVKAGDLGGWIEREENLSQDGSAWVHDEGCVYDEACVYGNARVFDEARVSGESCVFEKACVSGLEQVCNDFVVR